MDPEYGLKAYYPWKHKCSIEFNGIFLILSNIIPLDVYSQFKLLESTLSTFTLTTCLLSTKQTYPTEEPFFLLSLLPSFKGSSGIFHIFHPKLLQRWDLEVDRAFSAPQFVYMKVQKVLVPGVGKRWSPFGLAPMVKLF